MKLIMGLPFHPLSSKSLKPQDFLLKARRAAYKLVYAQGIIALLIAGGWFLYGGGASFLSALLGAIAWIVPSFYFIRKCFIIPKNLSQSPLGRPQTLVGRFYLAEFVKLLSSGLLIILFLKLAPVKLNLLPFFSGYCGAILTIFITPYVYRSH